jgi:hypothetical protein
MRSRQQGRQRKDAVLCPACGSRRAVPIVYGFPASRLAEQAKQHRIALGGCTVTEGDPTHTCLHCEHHWGHVTLR